MAAVRGARPVSAAARTRAAAVAAVTREVVAEDIAAEAVDMVEAEAIASRYRIEKLLATISSLRPERAPPSEFGPSFLRQCFFKTHHRRA